MSVAQQNCKHTLQTALNANLFQAVFNNNLTGVTKALAAGANPSSVTDLDPGNTSLLIYAAESNVAIAQTLIAAKANVSFQNSQGETALTAAAGTGNLTPAQAVTLVQTLLAAKSPVNAQDNTGATALTYAAFANNLELVNVLLASGANPNFQTNSANTSTTALILAAQAGNEAMVKALAGVKGINANFQDNTGSTALIYAAKAENIAMIQDLVSIKGIDANKQDNTGMTALMYAAITNLENDDNNLLSILELLVEISGINLNVLNKSKNAPMLCAPSSGATPIGCKALDFATSPPNDNGNPISNNCTTFLKKHGATPTVPWAAYF